MKFEMAVRDSLKNSWRLGTIVAAVSIAVAGLIKYLEGISLQMTTGSIAGLKQQALDKGIAGDLGSGFVDFLQGIVPFDLTSIVYLFIGSYILVFFGRTMVNMGLPQVFFIQRKDMRKITSVLLYGTLVGSVVLGFMTGVGVWATLLSLFLYYIGISIAIFVLMRAFSSLNRWLGK